MLKNLIFSPVSFPCTTCQADGSCSVDTHDKQNRVGVTLTTSVPAVLYTVLLIIGIATAQCFVLRFYRFDTLPFGIKKKLVYLSEFVLCGITGVTSLDSSLKKNRTEMDSLL